MDEALTPTVKYGDAIRRRLPLGLLVALVLVVLTIAVALGLPAVYKSRAIILIEQQDIPEDLVRSMVTSYADQRIQVISQRVLTSANLTSIIEKFDLYADERKSDPIEVVLEEMREDITVEPISADVVDQRSGRPTKATIAFELAFDNKVPMTAQRVTSDLVSLFLSENLKQRAEAAEDTLSFLTSESERLGTAVGDLEAAVAEFKERHAEALPELSNLNLQLMSRAEQDLIQLDNQIRSLEQQRVYLESELAQQEPRSEVLVSETGQRIFGPADRLKALEAEYITLRARYGSRHPDVLTMKREIDSLRKEVGGATASTELEARLQALKAELAVEREKYSGDHPDIRALNREIRSLEEEVSVAGRHAMAEEPSADEAPDNPAYIQLRARLDATESDLRSLRAQQSALREKVDDYEKRLTAAPQVEREYNALVRDYEIALAEYREVQAKRQEAVLARSLEEGQQGERFNLIEPPVVPQEPASPNRVVIALLGVLISCIGGVGVGSMAEALDSRIYGRSGVSNLTGVPPLAVIPMLQSADSRRSLLRRRLFYVAGVLALIAAALLLVHFLFSPLDVLFYRGLRVLG